MDDDTRHHGEVITPFTRSRLRTLTLENGSRPQARRHHHPVRVYLDMLRDEEFVSRAEHTRLARAVEPLLREFPDLKASTVQRVRTEMARPENNKYVLRDKEETYWHNVRRKGRQPIPGFVPEEGLKAFLVTPDNDPDRTVVFMRPEYAKPLSPYVPPRYRMAEVFYYVILRMFRRHVENHG